MYKSKSLLVFIFIVISTIKVQSQKISFDRIEKDGVRHIGTESLKVKIDDANYDFSLTVFSESNSNNYCLLVSSINKIEENCVLLLKLGNEETIKLIANNVHVGQIDYPKYNPVIGSSSISGIMSTQKVDYYVSIYPLDTELLDKIESFGITKTRIAFYNNYYEKNWINDWNNDKLGKFIKKSRLKLEEELNSKKSIENGF